MKIYLAARYSRREELVAYATMLHKLGHEVTSTWLDSNYEGSDYESTHCPPEDRARIATCDFRDIMLCNMLIHFTEEPRNGSRGGRHVEMGIALGLMKRVAIVGPAENIFCFHEDVRRFDNFDDLIERGL